MGCHAAIFDQGLPVTSLHFLSIFLAFEECLLVVDDFALEVAFEEFKGLPCMVQMLASRHVD